MSRTIRNRHNRGRMWVINVEARKKDYINRGYSEDHIAKYVAGDIRYNSRLHRDGFLGNRGASWWSSCKEDQVRTLRKEMNRYIHNQEWDEEVIPQKRNLTWYYD